MLLNVALTFYRCAKLTKFKSIILTHSKHIKEGWKNGGKNMTRSVCLLFLGHVNLFLNIQLVQKEYLENCTG